MQANPISLQRQIFWVVVILVLFGQIILFSASGILGIQRHQSEFYFITRQATAGLAGFVALFVMARLKLSFLRTMAFPILILQICLVALTHLPSFGHAAGGATRWLRIHGFVFQPSETAKIALSIYLARILSTNQSNPLSKRAWVFWMVPVTVLLALIFKQPDMGTTVLLVAMALAMFFVAGIRLTYVLGTIGIGSAGFIVAMLHSDYRRRRFSAFLNPWADPQGTGFQTIQSLISFHSGRLFGTGIGNGNSKLFFLPEVHTDFIFALIAEELGFMGAAILLLTFAYLTYTLFKTSARGPCSFSSLLAFGLALSLSLQICVNLGGVTGLLPVKGLPLPFISWGRSALIANLAMIGILLNIARSSGHNQTS